MEIHKVWILSTGHITYDDSLEIDFSNADKYDYGWQLHVPTIKEYFDRHPCSLELSNLIDLAILWDIEYLRLDQDGPTEESLPYFDW